MPKRQKMVAARSPVVLEEETGNAPIRSLEP